MKVFKVITIVAVALMVAGALLAVGGCGEKGDEGHVKELIQKQNELLFTEANWEAIYMTYSPAYRDVHPYAEFVEGGKTALAMVRATYGTGDVEFTDIKVRVEGNKAYASYKIEIGGKIVTTTEDDIYVKVDGKWYDED